MHGKELFIGHQSLDISCLVVRGLSGDLHGHLRAEFLAVLGGSVHQLVVHRPLLTTGGTLTPQILKTLLKYFQGGVHLENYHFFNGRVH